jgi:SAM-dependent methyltransferase
MQSKDDPPSRHYLDKEGKRYFDERFTDEQEFGRRWQSRYFATYCDETMTVLDFGCGDGTILRALAARRKLAVEVNPHCVRRIEGTNSRERVPIEVHAGLDEIETGSLDVVVSNHSLEHVPHPLATLRDLHRVLASGGVLVLVTPFDDWRSGGCRSWTPGDRQNHLYTWTPMNIGNLLKEAGFEVRSSELQSTAWSPRIFWVHRRLGERAFALACRLLSSALDRREVLSVAFRPELPGNVRA